MHAPPPVSARARERAPGGVPDAPVYSATLAEMDDLAELLASASAMAAQYGAVRIDPPADWVQPPLRMARSSRFFVRMQTLPAAPFVDTTVSPPDASPPTPTRRERAAAQQARPKAELVGTREARVGVPGREGEIADSGAGGMGTARIANGHVGVAGLCARGGEEGDGSMAGMPSRTGAAGGQHMLEGVDCGADERRGRFARVRQSLTALRTAPSGSGGGNDMMLDNVEMATAGQDADVSTAVGDRAGVRGAKLSDSGQGIEAGVRPTTVSNSVWDAQNSGGIREYEGGHYSAPGQRRLAAEAASELVHEIVDSAMTHIAVVSVPLRVRVNSPSRRRTSPRKRARACGQPVGNSPQGVRDARSTAGFRRQAAQSFRDSERATAQLIDDVKSCAISLDHAPRRDRAEAGVSSALRTASNAASRTAADFAGLPMQSSLSRCRLKPPHMLGLDDCPISSLQNAGIGYRRSTWPPSELPQSNVGGALGMQTTTHGHAADISQATPRPSDRGAEFVHVSPVKMLPPAQQMLEVAPVAKSASGSALKFRNPYGPKGYQAVTTQGVHLEEQVPAHSRLNSNSTTCRYSYEGKHGAADLNNPVLEQAPHTGQLASSAKETRPSHAVLDMQSAAFGREVSRAWEGGRNQWSSYARVQLPSASANRNPDTAGTKSEVVLDEWHRSQSVGLELPVGDEGPKRLNPGVREYAKGSLSSILNHDTVLCDRATEGNFKNHIDHQQREVMRVTPSASSRAERNDEVFSTFSYAGTAGQLADRNSKPGKFPPQLCDRMAPRLENPLILAPAEVLEPKMRGEKCQSPHLLVTTQPVGIGREELLRPKSGVEALEASDGRTAPAQSPFLPLGPKTLISPQSRVGIAQGESGTRNPWHQQKLVGGGSVIQSGIHPQYHPRERSAGVGIEDTSGSADDHSASDAPLKRTWGLEEGRGFSSQLLSSPAESGIANRQGALSGHLNFLVAESEKPLSQIRPPKGAQTSLNETTVPSAALAGSESQGVERNAEPKQQANRAQSQGRPLVGAQCFSPEKRISGKAVAVNVDRNEVQLDGLHSQNYTQDRKQLAVRPVAEKDCHIYVGVGGGCTDDNLTLPRGRGKDFTLNSTGANASEGGYTARRNRSVREIELNIPQVDTACEAEKQKLTKKKPRRQTGRRRAENVCQMSWDQDDSGRLTKPLVFPDSSRPVTLGAYEKTALSFHEEMRAVLVANERNRVAKTAEVSSNFQDDPARNVDVLEEQFWKMTREGLRGRAVTIAYGVDVEAEGAFDSAGMSYVEWYGTDKTGRLVKVGKDGKSRSRNLKDKEEAEINGNGVARTVLRDSTSGSDAQGISGGVSQGKAKHEDRDEDLVRPDTFESAARAQRGNAGYKPSHAAQQEPSSHVGNLNRSGVLRHLPTMPGINHSMYYVGQLFTRFCWHTEDAFLNSVSYLHGGSAEKVWYAIPPREACTFEDYACKHVFGKELVEKYGAGQTLLMNKTTTFDPRDVHRRGIKVFRVVHKPGSFVLTAPRAYHAGFNCGFNIAEAVNFAGPTWFPVGREASRLAREVFKPLCVPWEYLLFHEARYVRDKSTAVRISKGSFSRPASNAAILAKELDAVITKGERRIREYAAETNCRLTMLRDIDAVVKNNQLGPEFGHGAGMVCSLCGHACHFYAEICGSCPDSFEARCEQHFGQGHRLCQVAGHKSVLVRRHDPVMLFDILCGLEEIAGITVSPDIIAKRFQGYLRPYQTPLRSSSGLRLRMNLNKAASRMAPAISGGKSHRENVRREKKPENKKCLGSTRRLDSDFDSEVRTKKRRTGSRKKIIRRHDSSGRSLASVARKETADSRASHGFGKVTTTRWMEADEHLAVQDLTVGGKTTLPS